PRREARLVARCHALALVGPGSVAHGRHTAREAALRRDGTLIPASACQVPGVAAAGSWDLQRHCQSSSVESTATLVCAASAGSQAATHLAISCSRSGGSTG